jgi:hypothetical protein
MRSQIDLLLYEATRKPDIRLLVDNIGSISDDYLETVQVPLPWYRLALKKLKKQRNDEINYKKMESFIAANIIDSYIPDEAGTIREYLDDGYISLDRGGLEMKPGALVWFPASGGVWIDTIFSRNIDKRFNNSRFIRSATKSEYIEACRQKRNRNVGNIPFTVVEGQPTVSKTNSLFTIQRI